ncbi:MAG: ABC transporter ATP-binding protein [Myxococcota bacterium]
MSAPENADVRGLEARGLAVRRGARQVLMDVDVDAAPGRVTAVLGPNGAGKSTLLLALAGLVRATGHVRADGVDLAELSLRERARRVAYVPQRSQLRSALRVEEVVAQGRYAHGSRSEDAVREALETARAAELEGRVFTRLSVGEQQRVLVARALATRASVLLLDEPTASQDIAQALATFALLRELAAAGRTVAVVVHALEHAHRFADDAILLDGGKVVRTGLATETLAPGPLREVFGVRMERGGLRFELHTASDGSEP